MILGSFTEKSCMVKCIARGFERRAGAGCLCVAMLDSSCEVGVRGEADHRAEFLRKIFHLCAGGTLVARLDIDAEEHFLFSYGHVMVGSSLIDRSVPSVPTIVAHWLNRLISRHTYPFID